jgi:hypothetical protein
VWHESRASLDNSSTITFKGKPSVLGEGVEKRGGPNIVSKCKNNKIIKRKKETPKKRKAWETRKPRDGVVIFQLPRISLCPSVPRELFITIRNFLLHCNCIGQTNTQAQNYTE